MIKRLKKYYKTVNNHDELFGIDGMEHAVISLAVHIAVLIALLLFGYLSHMTLAKSLIYVKYGLIITWLIMRGVWYYIEYTQEKAMQQKDPNRKGALYNLLKYSKARKRDMGYPLLGDTLFITSFFLLV